MVFEASALKYLGRLPSKSYEDNIAKLNGSNITLFIWTSIFLHINIYFTYPDTIWNSHIITDFYCLFVSVVWIFPLSGALVISQDVSD